MLDDDDDGLANRCATREGVVVVVDNAFREPPGEVERDRRAEVPG